MICPPSSGISARLWSPRCGPRDNSASADPSMVVDSDTDVTLVMAAMADTVDLVVLSEASVVPSADSEVLSEALEAPSDSTAK